MAEIRLAEKELEKLFDEVRDKTSIPQWVEFKVLVNNKQKELLKLVKANDLVELLADGLNFAVIVNADIFARLPVTMQIIAFDEILAGVKINDSDKLSVEKPDFNTYSGVLVKYGDAEIIKFHESVISLFDEKKQKEKEEKEAKQSTKRGRKSK